MFIYKVSNLINGKIYIGQTVQSVAKRFIDHCGIATKRATGILDKAIKKYGKENFTVETIDTANDIDELNEKEICWIWFYQSTNRKIGYNIGTGGKNRGHTAGENHPLRGRSWGHHTEEHKKKMSDLFKGKFLGGEKCTSRAKEVNSIPIIEITTVTRFSSTAEAGRYYGVNSTNIQYVLVGKSRYIKGGQIFEYADENLAAKYREIRNNIKGNQRKVTCLETEKVFNSVKEASIELSVSRTAIGNCLSGLSKSAGKLHFKYVY